MNFLVFAAACLAVCAATTYEEVQVPAQDNTYSVPSHSAPVYTVPDVLPYQPGNTHPKGNPPPPGYQTDFRKLKTLRVQGVTEARKRYFVREGDNYVRISCNEMSNSNNYTWLLADSRDRIPSFALQGTVVLAGGLNVEYVAKLGNRGKWEGRDYFLNDRQRFRRVGCYQGTVSSGLVTATN